MIETEVLKKQREARLAAEALFAPIAAPPKVSTSTVVTVRQRRMSSGPDEPSALVEGAEPSDMQAREPRVHLLAAQAPAVEPSPIEDKPIEVAPLEKAPDAPLQELVADAPIAPQVAEITAAPAAKLRKARPAKRPPHAQAAPAVAVTSAVAPPEQVTEKAAKKAVRARQKPAALSPASSAAAVAHDDSRPSGFAGYDWPVYPQLIAQIEDLKHQAEVLREREAAEAIRWIRQAVQQFDLSAQDLGFARSRR
jgi:DNA-binding protein H-NS